MTPLKHQIIQLLLPVLLEATRSQRPEKGKIDRKVRRVFDKYVPTAIQANYANFTAEMLEAATGKPMPRAKETSFPPIFTVVVPTNNTSAHKYPIGEPAIVTHQTNRRLLKQAGMGTSLSVDEIRTATDEEVEVCLNNLNEYELRFIMTDGIFAPYLAPMFMETELVAEKE